MIISVGTAYSGIEDLVVAVDLRYFDYRNTDGFGDQGYSPYGALNGLSWTNQLAIATGVQYRLMERLLLRAGYTFNTSPYGDEDTFYNVASLLELPAPTRTRRIVGVVGLRGLPCGLHAVSRVGQHGTRSSCRRARFPVPR